MPFVASPPPKSITRAAGEIVRSTCERSARAVTALTDSLTDRPSGPIFAPYMVNWQRVFGLPRRYDLATTRWAGIGASTYEIA